MRLPRKISGSLALAALVLPALPVSSAVAATPRLTNFSSCTTLKNRIVNAQGANGIGMFDRAVTGIAPPTAMRAAAPTASGGMAQAEAAMPSESKASAADGDFSRTNVQVDGVDEADIVKIDGQYSYHLTKNRLAISRIAANVAPQLLSLTQIDDAFQPQELFLEGERIIAIGAAWEDADSPEPMPLNAQRIAPGTWRPRTQTTRVEVWNIKDRTAPKKERTVNFEGNLVSSRSANGRITVVLNAYSGWSTGDAVSSATLVPTFSDSANAKAGTQPVARCASVSYFDTRPSQEFLVVANFSPTGGTIARKAILGSGSTVYATPDNVYVARQDATFVPVWRGNANDAERTNVAKFTIGNGSIRYIGKGSVPGHLLNQFSLDEFEGNLRVATTKGNSWDEKNPSTTGVYILDKNLKQVGKVDGLAPRESLYAARFMGERGYLVTFKKVDPLFVLDLKNPKAPKVLGKLKIPGYSDYLHPMDATHLIGIGKDAVEAETANGRPADFAWYQGLKLAVFDVTDVEHPKELWNTVVGDRGTDSPALHDHKAFFYNASKNILALPVTLAEIDPETKKDLTPATASRYGETTFQGAMVWRLTVADGFQPLGRISHVDDTDTYLKSGSWFYAGDQAIDRIHSVGDRLLTFSNAGIRSNAIPSLVEQGRVVYPANDTTPDPVWMEE